MSDNISHQDLKQLMETVLRAVRDLDEKVTSIQQKQQQQQQEQQHDTVANLPSVPRARPEEKNIRRPTDSTIVSEMERLLLLWVPIGNGAANVKVASQLCLVQSPRSHSNPGVCQVPWSKIQESIKLASIKTLEDNCFFLGVPVDRRIGSWFAEEKLKRKWQNAH
ncbi:hypothetical protein BC941DRAFT_160290 [Chlamydoabsidia padenii]|nr:hypothetical protein BC941DRAFT_160290 [Chlamydoabsidia padenii]